MKIALFGYTTPQSGVAGMGLGISRYTYNLAKSLRQLGQDVTLYVRNDYKPKERWIKTIPALKPNWYHYPFAVKRAAKKISAEIFHGDYVTTGAPLIWANKEPVAVTVHDAIPFTYDLSRMNLKDRIFVKWYMHCFRSVKKADAVIVRSKNAKKELARLTDIPKDKIFVTGGGIDTKTFYPLKKRKNKSDTTRIGYFGGLEGRKNIELLINAFKKISKQFPNVELHVGGSGKSLKELRKGNFHQVYFHGFIPFERENEFLNSLDIFVYPSLAEGFGQPVLEAMACGLPVIANNISSLPEVVRNGGILVRPNVNEMCNAIERLIGNKNLRRRLGKRALQVAKQQTWKECAKETEKVYSELIR